MEKAIDPTILDLIIEDASQSKKTVTPLIEKGRTNQITRQILLTLENIFFNVKERLS